jgi:hypothetical protein
VISAGDFPKVFLAKNKDWIVRSPLFNTCSTPMA